MYFWANIDERTGAEFIAKGLTAFGDHSVTDGFTVYQEITFSDGTVLRNVKVDSAIDAQFQASRGDPNAVYVVKKIYKTWLVYAVENNGGLRVGTLKGYVGRTLASVATMLLLIAVAYFASQAGNGLAAFLPVAAGALALLVAFHFRQLLSVVLTAARLRRSHSLGIV